jgi:hypothetical protein
MSPMISPRSGGDGVRDARLAGPVQGTRVIEVSMRCPDEPPIVVDAEPGFGRRRRPRSPSCGIPPIFGGTCGGFGATLLERKHPAPGKEVTHV